MRGWSSEGTGLLVAAWRAWARGDSGSRPSWGHRGDFRKATSPCNLPTVATRVTTTYLLTVWRRRPSARLGRAGGPQPGRVTRASQCPQPRCTHVGQRRAGANLTGSGRRQPVLICQLLHLQHLIDNQRWETPFSGHCGCLSLGLGKLPGYCLNYSTSDYWSRSINKGLSIYYVTQ